MNSLLWLSSLDFVTTLSLDRVHRRHDNVFKKDHDLSSVTRWCQPSRSAACKNGNIALACSFRFHFSRKTSVNRCGIQCKWNDLKPMESYKCLNTIWQATNSLSDIEWVDSNRDLFNIARIFASRWSSRGLRVRISLCRSWRPRLISVIQNWTVWSW
jgi:hypothetical protein